MSERDDSRIHVAAAEAIKPGERHVVQVNGKQVGVFNVAGSFVAYLNYCPHEGAPVCAGRTTGLVEADRPGALVYSRAGEVLCCPWHGWEFDLTTGECLVDRCRLLRYEVAVDDGQVYILPKRRG